MHHSTASALGVALVLAMSGCAMDTMERQQLRDVESREILRMPELVRELHRAMAALQGILAQNDELRATGLVLDRASLSLDSAHGITDDGTLALLVAGSELDTGANATGNISLVFTPPDAAWRPPDPDGEHARRMRALAAAYRDSPPCPAGDRRATNDPAAADHPPWEALVHLAAATIRDHLCVAGDYADGAPAPASFSVTVGVSVMTSGTEGVSLRLGTVAIGDKVTETTSSNSTISFTLRRSSD